MEGNYAKFDNTGLTPMFAIIKQSVGNYAIVEIVRDGKRFTWVDYPGLKNVRETRTKTLWRFPTKDAAEKQLLELSTQRVSLDTDKGISERE